MKQAIQFFEYQMAAYSRLSVLCRKMICLYLSVKFHFPNFEEFLGECCFARINDLDGIFLNWCPENEKDTMAA